MTFRASPALARRWRQVRHAALVFAALAVAHEAVYIVRYGNSIRLDAQMSLDGHDGHWALFLFAAAGAVLLLGAWSVWRLTIGARASAFEPSTREASATFSGEWRQVFRRLALVVPSLFLLQENVEHLLGHGHVEGLGIYAGAGSELALPVVLGVVAAVSALGALVRWREVILITRLRAAHARKSGRRPASTGTPADWGTTSALLRDRLLHVGRDLGRDPPTTSMA